MARIAIVTGATGGIGAEFVREISSNAAYADIDEIWAVGRNRDRLESLRAISSKVVAVEADLASDGVSVLARRLVESAPDLRLLVNNAGTAYMGPFEKMRAGQVEGMCTVNCRSLASLTAEALPYMHEGAGIVNVASAASFQPNPYLSLYSASKAFVRQLSRALAVELKDRGIRVTCACPGWVDTGMLPREKDGVKIRYPGMISPAQVARKALADNRKGMDMSVPSFFAQFCRLYSKWMPTKLVMTQWSRMIAKYVDS